MSREKAQYVKKLGDKIVKGSMPKFVPRLWNYW